MQQISKPVTQNIVTYDKLAKQIYGEFATLNF